MPGTPRKTQDRKYEVLVSFSGLSVGATFVQEADDLDWAKQHVETGYLRDVTEEVADVRGEVGQG
jgi:hypothetical protein